MAGVTQSLQISVSPETAFNYVADISKHGEWAQPGHKLTVEKTSEGEIAVGTTFRTTGYQFGKHEGEVRIVELIPSEKVVYESNDDVAHNRHSFLLAPTDGGTMVTKSLQVLESKSLFFKVLTPMLGIIAPRGLNADLRNIRAQLEA